jgi:hypothetical protein
MNVSFGISGSRSAGNWEAEIKAALDELRNHGHEMSPYERNVISREIKRRQDELIPVVGAKVIGEWKGTITKYQEAQKRMKAERSAEINRWDSAKLNAEMDLFQRRVDMVLKAGSDPLHGDAPISAKIQQVYNDALQSGDIHKQRAAVEVIKTVTGRIQAGQEKIAVNQLARDAEKVELELMQTEGTRKAQAELVQAENELITRRANLDKVSQVLGMGGIDDVFATSPFAKAASLVERDRATGELIIHGENDPEVTGVLWKEGTSA